MEKITKETITTEDKDTYPVEDDSTEEAPVEKEATSFQTIEYLVYFFFGALEVLLLFRLILKIAGASFSNTFVGLVYGITGIFILPFQGIFHNSSSQGIETGSVFEPSTLVAILVYAVLAVGVVKLLRIVSGKRQAS